MKRSNTENDVHEDAGRRKRLAYEIAISRINEDKINSYSAAISYLETSKRRALSASTPSPSSRRLCLSELKNKIAEARDDLIEATVDLNQTELLVSRMQLSWGAPHCTKALKERDEVSEKAASLLRELSMARRQKSATEGDCNMLQESNKLRLNSLAEGIDKAPGRDADVPGAVVEAIDSDDDTSRTRGVFLSLCSNAGFDWTSPSVGNRVELTRLASKVENPRSAALPFDISDTNIWAIRQCRGNFGTRAMALPLMPVSPEGDTSNSS